MMDTVILAAYAALCLHQAVSNLRSIFDPQVGDKMRDEMLHTMGISGTSDEWRDAAVLFHILMVGLWSVGFTIAFLIAASGE